MTSQPKKNHSAAQSKRGQPVKIKGKHVISQPARNQGKSDGKPISIKPRSSRYSGQPPEIKVDRKNSNKDKKM